MQEPWKLQLHGFLIKFLRLNQGFLIVGFYEGIPVATSALFLQNDVAGVWDVTTLPKFRRKGIGTDMTLHALKYAKDLCSCGIGVLTASSDGESVYRKIGFRKIKEFRVANVSVKQSQFQNID